MRPYKIGRKNMNYENYLNLLEKGEIRAAEKGANGVWVANTDVKEAILEAFKNGKNQPCEAPWEGFIDKHNIPPRRFTVEDGVRLVPGGSSVRRGSYVAKGVIIMPPAYINIGAYVDEGTMVDSNALVGSCAQIGKKVHLSAGVQIGGVLEPIGMAPVVIEDEAFIGAGAVIVEGVQVGRRAVIAPGVNLSKSIPVFDVVNNRRLERGQPIPENAVVVPGTRPLSLQSDWVVKQGLSLQCAIIIKYRDENSDASLELEDFLR
jgi:2,3,4,5-tetrahydropyridine-2,6-dicarboxylate N-succinyltransferase